MTILTTPTQHDLQYRQTAYSYDEICAAIADLSAAYESFLPVCQLFNDTFQARYFSRVGPYFVTDKAKIDQDYERLSKLRQATYDIDEPSMGSGFGGASRSGGSQEAYPIKKWTALAKRYRNLTAKLEKALV